MIDPDKNEQSPTPHIGDEDISIVSEGGILESSSSSDDDDMGSSSNPISGNCNQTYLPLTGENGGNLECDESAYVFYHRAQTGAPCLSFDVIPDDLGTNRADQFPLTCYLVAGTQADKTHANQLMVMKMSNLHKSKHKAKNEESESEDESEDDEEEQLPELSCAQIKHSGCINRLRVTALSGRPIAATWSELHHVYVWDLSSALATVKEPQREASVSKNLQMKPLFTFKGHLSEGFAMDWCTLKPGVLATGDCQKNIHLWTPQDGGSWLVDQCPYTGHTASVEDIQWSPDEANVLASCSVDKSIRIWDMRIAPNKACMLTQSDAHDADVNVISWNRTEPFILSGGDDGVIKVWDLRQFQKNSPPVALYKHHQAAITSVEWHPTDSSVFAASGADDQLTLWDLAVERDTEAMEQDIKEIPPQLLFIHQGQQDIKEVHWHPQMPGLMISTAHSGFNVFRTISI